MRPSREPIRQASQTYCINFQTARHQYFFRNERWAILLLNTITRYQDSYALHDFVIMPDHAHLLLSPQVPLEKAAQLIKGGFSFQAKRAFEWSGDIWQPGFSDHRIRDAHDYAQHVTYIQQNIHSLKQENYRFCGLHSGLALTPPPSWPTPMLNHGVAEVPTLQSS